MFLKVFIKIIFDFFQEIMDLDNELLFFEHFKGENNWRITQLGWRQILHWRNGLPQPALEILSFQSGRFFITKKEFNFRIKLFSDDPGDIKRFARFVIAKNYKLYEKNLVCADIKVFTEFLRVFLKKEFVDPRDMFRRICYQYPFEFFLLRDLCRET